MGSTVAENGGTSREVNARIQKARGSFSILRRVWLCKSLRKDTKIRIFNACVKSVLSYGCETWLVTNEIQHKIQTFVNRCLRYIIKNMVAKYYFQQRSMESNRTRRYKFRNKKKKIQMDRSHIKKRGRRDTKGCPTLEPSGKRIERQTEKQMEIGNHGSE